MTIRAVLFDRDGVLTYFNIPAAAAVLRPLIPISIYEVAQRWQTWGAAVGFPTNLAQEEQFFGGFWDGLSAEFGLSVRQREQLGQFNYTSYVVGYADAAPALAALHARGLRIGVLSNFSLASIDATLAAAGLAPWVDTALAATVIGAAKPAPAAYRYALQALQVKAEECLFFDDELPCVEGGRAIGLAGYWVDRSRSAHAAGAGVICDLSAVASLVASHSAL